MPTHLNASFLWHRTLDNTFEVAPFLQADDPDRAELASLAAGLSYRFKAAVASLCQPDRVLHIGCGVGYAAAAILSSVPRTCYVAVDRGDEGRFEYARALLPERYPDADLRFIETDTRQDTTPWLRPLLAEGTFDLVFVDGDRSRRGRGHDLQTAYWAVHSGGFILTEDYDACVDVREAVHDFLFATSLPHIYCCTARGDVLINVHKK